jgi:hypothetical protein
MLATNLSTKNSNINPKKFLNNHLIEKKGTGFQASKRIRRSFRVKDNESLAYISDSIQNLLPKSATSLFFFPSDIIGTSMQRPLNQTLDYDIDAISGLLMPRSTETYRVDIKKYGLKEKLPTFSSSQHFFDFFGIENKNGELLKLMFIVVGSDRRYSELKAFLKSLNTLRKEETESGSNSFSVTGGLILSESHEITIINLILKDRIQNKGSIQVGQIIVPDMDRSDFDAYFDKKLAMLKTWFDSDEYLRRNKTKLGRKLFAIKVNCIGRGSEYHGSKDHELNMFRKHFERVPLVGFYGEGEIGHDYLASSSKQSISSDTNSLIRGDIDLYGYSSIFTLIYLE